MKKAGLRAAAVIFGIMFFDLSGCALSDTPPDELIVRQKETEEQQAETVASADGLTIIGQVQAEETYKCALEKGSVDILVHADVEVPDEEGFKDWQAVPRYFEQKDIDGWIQVLAQGKTLWDYGEETDSMYYMSYSDVADWMSELNGALEEVLQEMASADAEQMEELDARAVQIEEAINLCEDYLDKADVDQAAIKMEKEWKLEASSLEDVEKGVYEEPLDEAHAAADGVPETEAEASGDGLVESLHGFVDIQDVFAPWADDSEKTYICDILNNYTDESLGERSGFSFFRKERSAYHDDSVHQNATKPDTAISRKTMRKAADALLEDLGIRDMKFAQAVPMYNDGFDGYPESSHFLDYEKAWKFCYVRNLEGISVTYAPHDAMTEENVYSAASYLNNWYTVSGEVEFQIQEQLNQSQMRKSEKNFWRQETLEITFDDEGLVGIEWENPCEVRRISGESVFLLPFSEIRQIFETSMPEQSLFELFADVGISLNVDITEVKLEYMREQELDDSGGGRMIPVWDFCGALEMPDISEALGDEDGSWFKSLLSSGQGKSLLTINATDGTVVNR